MLANVPLRALIVGGSRGGVGMALSKFLSEQRGAEVITTSRTGSSGGEGHHKTLKLDLMSESDFPALSAELKNMSFVPNLICNCTGVLQVPDSSDSKLLRPEKGLSKISLQQLQHTFAVNTFGNALLLKELLNFVDKSEHTVFATWSARVGSISGNELGGWYSYRASKAAQNMLVKTAAVELKRNMPKLCVVAVHPGTVQTELSNPFVGKAKSEKLCDTWTSREEVLNADDSYMYFTADVATRHMWEHVLSTLTLEDSGRFYDYAKREIDW